uniref:Putative lysine-specific demethylase JMJD5 n=1 Tax=Rhizophora mucronata TaxID=61149 RepID=A0A2P2L7T2_RHIMU
MHNSRLVINPHPIRMAKKWGSTRDIETIVNYTCRMIKCLIKKSKAQLLAKQTDALNLVFTHWKVTHDCLIS